MVAILQDTFSNAFSFMKIAVFFFLISLKLIWKGPINNELVLAWIVIVAKQATSSEPMMIQFPDAYMRHSASMI